MAVRSAKAKQFFTSSFVKYSNTSEKSFDPCKTSATVQAITVSPVSPKGSWVIPLG